MTRTLALLALALLTACTSTQSSGPVSHDTLRMALSLEPKSLNPILEAGSAYQLTADLVFDPLLQYDEHAAWIPALALAEPTLANGGISKDGLHVTFHLRRGVLWQDGAPFTSRYVRFTFEALLNPRNNVGSRDPFTGIASMSTPDAYTIVFNLKAPRASILSDLWYAIVPAHLLAQYPDINRVAFNSAPIGTGPFRVVDWKRGEHLTLAGNERYWRGPPHLRNIRIGFVPDNQTALIQLKTGESDFFWLLEAGMIPQVAAIPRLHVVKTWSRTWSNIIFNTSDPVVADVRVRRAIAQGIDLDHIATTVMHDPERRKAILEAVFGWAYDPSVKLPAYDPAHSAALLDEAGWKVGSGGVRQKGGRTLTLTLLYANNSAGLRNVALLIASDLQHLGIAVTHKTAPFAQMYTTAENGGLILGGKFAINYGSLVTNPDPDAAWFLACSEIPPKGFNYARFCDPTMDAALHDARLTYDVARRKRDYAIVQRRLAEEVPLAFVARGRDNDVGPVWLTELKPSPFSPFWNAWKW